MAIDGAVVPWADLLPEICNLVVDRLDAFSVLSFPLVCKSWAAAYMSDPRRLREGAPTLLSCLDGHTYGSDDDGNEAGTFTLHDVSTGKSFRAEAEGLKGRWWIGGKDDWMVTVDQRCNIQLYSPITGDGFRLPSLATTPRAATVERPRSHRRQHLQQVILCRTPAHQKGYLAVARFRSLLAFTVAGDKCWTMLKKKNHPDRLMTSFLDAIFLEGKIFAVTRLGTVYSWDMDSAAKDPEGVVLPPEFPFRRFLPRLLHRFNLAPSSNGHLLLVSTYGDNGNQDPCSMTSFHARCILLHRLDVGSGAWQPVSSLAADQALFVGTTEPFYVTVPRGSKDLKVNCVYVACMSGYEAVVFDLEQGSDTGFEPLGHPTEGRRLLQIPMWFRPTARPLGRRSATKLD